VTCKKKQGDFNFALESEGDFSQYMARISSTSPGFVSPEVIILKVFSFTHM